MSPVSDTHRDIRLNLRLTVEPSEIGGIRHIVIQQLAEWECTAIVDDVVLVVGELLANVHAHAEGVCGLTVERRGERLVVRVSDTVMTPPALRAGSGSTETGRGLVLIDALTEHWETTITSTGKVITCTFTTPTPPPT
ncbi:ATP-binding protein [Streptomyces sp. NPDC014894]|uniref:ATP-binding protein n=1 Tax=unclassified Streptomyces TaxID=2593676 RepID=UPI0036F9B3AD